MFTVSEIGKVPNSAALNALEKALSTEKATSLERVVLLRPEKSRSPRFQLYEDLITKGRQVSDADLEARMQSVDPSDVCNLQFTSGTTGNPKAAMLTHK